MRFSSFFDVNIIFVTQSIIQKAWIYKDPQNMFLLQFKIPKL